MPKRGENIYKRKDGRWEGRFIKAYDGSGKANYAYVYGKSYAETKRKLTVADILALIKSTLAYARDQGCTVCCNLDRVSVKSGDVRLRVLSEAERTLLESELLSDMDRYKFGVLLSLYTGIRVGELCALRWNCFHRDRGLLEVRETLQRIQDVTSGGTSKTRIVISSPKSKCSLRTIPLPDCILAMADAFRGPPDAFVLTGSADRFVEPRTMQNHFKRYAQASGIAPANYHALRHTFATRCVELGFGLKSLSEILGHASVNITLNRYMHASIDLKRSNMNKLTLSAPT